MKWPMFTKDEVILKKCKDSPHPDEHNLWGLVLDAIVAASLIMIIVTMIGGIMLALSLW